MGPKGETPSWTFSHSLSVGAFGGFDGFQGTTVVFTTESLISATISSPAFAELENDIGDLLIGPFLVPG
jgi:hypothetical protein